MSTYTDEHAAAAADIMAAFTTIADTLDKHAGWLEDQLAGGQAPKWLVHQAITDSRYIAAVTRGDASAARAATP